MNFFMLPVLVGKQVSALISEEADAGWNSLVKMTAHSDYLSQYTFSLKAFVLTIFENYDEALVAIEESRNRFKHNYEELARYSLTAFLFSILNIFRLKGLGAREQDKSEIIERTANIASGIKELEQYAKLHRGNFEHFYKFALAMKMELEKSEKEEVVLETFESMTKEN